MQPGEFPLKGRQQTYPDAVWLQITQENQELLSSRQARLLVRMREWLTLLHPPRLSAAETYGVYDAFAAALYIVLPLHRGMNVSFQLSVDDEEIVGDWQDSHYVWDLPGADPSFQLRWTVDADGVIGEVIRLAERQLRRPLHRSRFRFRHVDGSPGWQRKGSLKPGKPSGFFDPL